MISRPKQLVHAERYFHGPDWRRQLAIAAAERGGRRRGIRLDEVIRRAADFYWLRQQGSSNARTAADRYPEIAAAEAAWSNPSLREQLQLMLLGGCEPAEIAARLELSPTVVEMIEGLFFDVRPMINSPIWVLAHVIRREADKGHDDHAARLRMALFGRQIAVRALLDAEDGLPLDHSERIAADMLLLEAKSRQCLEIHLGPERAREFLELYSNFHLETRRLDLEREKFAFAVQRWKELRDLARARIELRREELAQQANRAERGRDAAGVPETSGVIPLSSQNAA